MEENKFQSVHIDAPIVSFYKFLKTIKEDFDRFYRRVSIPAMLGCVRELRKIDDHLLEIPIAN
ncbi:hypothetical protein A8709_23080 [Paenibacillus pectinilyticus]|uniref:Uncharacterized protein n=1 Tax=Paenibacillus pectinilyticus TaxID=512399 RepID=A0A1C0ZRM8_9BACL|nr:hypothetical protein A8709_23080 [Paenibacillus pectinilyticus]